MTKKQYEQLKQAARRDAGMDEFGIGFARSGDYVVVYSTYSGYDASNSPIISRRSDFYQYVSSCRKLAQIDPNMAAQQLADCRAFLEAYKK
mgnify:CR=1 FL=1|nr:MAG TPA: hypothetical protein [Caudoviricetes sp.]